MRFIPEIHFRNIPKLLHRTLPELYLTSQKFSPRNQIHRHKKVESRAKPSRKQKLGTPTKTKKLRQEIFRASRCINMMGVGLSPLAHAAILQARHVGGEPRRLLHFARSLVYTQLGRERERESLARAYARCLYN